MLPFAVKNGQGLGNMLRNLPDTVDRSQYKLSYRPAKDTVLVANANSEVSLFTSELFVGGTAKDRWQYNLVNPGRAIFGDAEAVIVGARIGLPRHLADGTTFLTLTNAHNLLRAFCELKIDRKTIFYCEAEDLPQGQGLYYQASEVTAAAAPALTSWTNGIPHASNRFIFEEPEMYSPNEKIEMTVSYPASGGAVLTANAHLQGKLDAFVFEHAR